MDFSEAYEELERDFRQRVVEDMRLFSGDMIFLPNVNPEAPVDYVLVGMEPSLRGWAKDLVEARRKIEEGFRNFGGSPKDDLLHYCIFEYLCGRESTYYLTDLAKGAMETTSPAAGDMKKYELWYPLLEKELGLVAKPDAKVISIGGKVGGFLARKGLYGHAGSISHYSTTASGYRGREVAGREKEFAEFRTRMEHLPNGKAITESQKKLMFDYKVMFGRIRRRDETGWLRWHEKWSRRLARS